jgi:hypothetical protein
LAFNHCRLSADTDLDLNDALACILSHGVAMQTPEQALQLPLRRLQPHLSELGFALLG